jgi:hypothetical protein
LVRLKVIFRVMHEYMMAVIGFRGLSEEWSYNPREIMIEERISLLKKFSVACAMQHEAKRTLECKII